jgi:hypothetical protein
MSERIMPERWFYGSSGNWMISSVIADYTGWLRPLAEGERYLGAFIVPAFQRGLLWTEAQKVKLIESIYIGMPIGAIVWNQTKAGGKCDRWLLDGQQRMTAIMGFVAGDFAVRGWRYPDLPVIEQRHFERMNIGVIETQIEDEAMCREVYDRLVYGGTPHEPKLLPPLEDGDQAT